MILNDREPDPDLRKIKCSRRPYPIRASRSRWATTISPTRPAIGVQKREKAFALEVDARSDINDPVMGKLYGAKKETCLARSPSAWRMRHGRR
jgi:hypothetical protein